MKNELIDDIQIQIKPYLNQNQYLKLTKILIDEFENIEIINRNINLINLNNEELLTMFLSAKSVEGCSNKTLNYYKKTLQKMLIIVDKRIEDIKTDDLRNYLTFYKETNNISKTTIDNVRRIFSSFFSWLEDEDYIIKNPVKRIHRIKKGRVVKDVLTDENLETLCDNCDNLEN